MNKIVLAAAVAASVAAFPALAEEDSSVDPLLTIWTRDANDYNAFSKCRLPTDPASRAMFSGHSET